MITRRMSRHWLSGIFVSLFVCYASSIVTGIAWGADPTAPPAAAEPPAKANNQSNSSSGQSKTVTNDKTNYVGDRVSFSRPMIVTVEAADQTVKGKVCLPRKYLLRGGNAYTANGANNSATPETGTRFILLKPSGSPNRLPGTKSANAAASQPAAPCTTADLPKDFDNSAAATLVVPGTVIRVTSQQLQDNPPDRIGLAFGVLTVPFKYQLTGNKDFTGSASLGSYIGYRTDNAGLGYGITYIAFLAASNISVPANAGSNTPNSNSTTTHNLFGISYGGGAVATIKGSFQAGLVIGWDRVSKSDNYQYNGKPWLAVMIGYDFLQ